MNNTNLIFRNDSNIIELTKQVNKIRLANKNNWYQVTFENETTREKTRIKCFNTWVQLSEKPIFSNCMDATITQFKNNISKGLEKLIKL